jgi:hypothetical protein
VRFHLRQVLLYNGNKDSKMSKHVTAGKKNCVTLMIPQRTEIIRRSEFGKKNLREYMAPYNIGLLIMI